MTLGGPRPGAATRHVLSEVWRLRPDLTVPHGALADVAETLRCSPAQAGDRLADEIEHLVRHAHGRNEARVRGLEAAAPWWWVALACALAELGLALAARLLTV